MLENLASWLFWSYLLLLKPPSQPQTQVGMITKLNHAAQKTSLKLAIIVFNVLPPTFLTLLIKDADHAQLITLTTIKLKDVTVKSHVNFQDNSTPTTFANAQLIKREIEESGTNLTELATVHQISHSGTVNIVLLAQLELNSIQKKNNVITVQTDSSEITAATPVFQDFDHPIYTFIVLLFSLFFSNSFNS